MPLLKIHQYPGSGENCYHIEVSAEDIPNLQPQTLRGDIEFVLSPQNRERIRWYLEDFLQFDQDPAPQIANRVEQLMAEIGEELFRGIFEGSTGAIKLWAATEPHLATTRIEIASEIAEATAIPWELMRDPSTGTWLTLSASELVRSQRRAIATVAPVQTDGEKVRILLIICRPKGVEDVPFRSVAGRLVMRLSEDARQAFDLDVLQPPTYEQLAMTLRLAHEACTPYHIVHFDGHGVYAEPEALADAGKLLNHLTVSIRPGPPVSFAPNVADYAYGYG